MPLSPCILRSVTSTPGKSTVNTLRADDACSWTSVSNPASPSHCVTAWRIGASSSTSRTGPASGMDRILAPNRRVVMQRKFDRQFGAAFQPVSGADAATEILDDAVGDRQSKAKPVADTLGGKERIENPVDEFGSNPGTV